MPLTVTRRLLRIVAPATVAVVGVAGLVVPAAAQTSTTVPPTTTTVPPPTTTVPPPPPPPTAPPAPVVADPGAGAPAPPDAPPPPDVPPAPEPPMPDPSPTVRALLDHLAVLDAKDGRDAAASAVTGAEGARDVAREAERVARAGADDARAALREAQNRLGSLASIAYTRPNTSGRMASLLTGELTLADREADTVRVAIEHYNEVVLAARQGVVEADDRVVAAHRVVAGAEASVAAAVAARDQADSAAVDAFAEFVRADTEQARAASAPAGDPQPGNWQLSIEGDNVFTADELARWFTAAATLAGGEPQATVPITELAQAFIDEGRDEGLRGDMAFAQAILETGSFTNDDTINHNNFAGVGHCDSCDTGFTFATAQLGVRAQIQLLKSYAETQPHYVHDLVDERLHGPAGCCQTWNQLSHVWATGPNYGPKILGIYALMLQWLVDDRSGMHDPAATAGTLAGL